MLSHYNFRKDMLPPNPTPMAVKLIVRSNFLLKRTMGLSHAMAEIENTDQL